MQEISWLDSWGRKGKDGENMVKNMYFCLYERVIWHLFTLFLFGNCYSYNVRCTTFLPNINYVLSFRSQLLFVLKMILSLDRFQIVLMLSFNINIKLKWKILENSWSSVWNKSVQFLEVATLFSFVSVCHRTRLCLNSKGVRNDHNFSPHVIGLAASGWQKGAEWP